MERPLSGGDELARDRAVSEVGMEALLQSWVRLRPSMLPLVTRVSSSSARSSVDSFSSWIILGEQGGSGLGGRRLPPPPNPEPLQTKAAVWWVLPMVPT